MSTEHKKTESYIPINDIEIYNKILFDQLEASEQIEEQENLRQKELERRARIEQNHYKRVRQKEFYHLRLTITFIAVGVFALGSGYWVAKVQNQVSIAKLEKAEFEGGNTTREVSSIIYQDWKLKLVNQDNPLQLLYLPELTTLTNGVQVDCRIEGDLVRMIQAGKSEAGVDILVVSGYISRTEQVESFNNAIEDELQSGSEYYVAYTRVIKNEQLPSYDERELGLTVTLVGRDYQNLDSKQKDTATAKWLEENCQRFGFVLRYPDGKEDITGEVYQSWCFRYVGQNIASIIMSEGKTLEEYLYTK